ncbi:restriction endonuclease subunit S [Lachnospiraceae bacterium JLR.KK008]
MAKWFPKRLDEIVEFNPRETIKKGVIAKKIAMDKLQPFCRDITEFELESFSGGTKFRNGDTIMARITPCLENGKTAKVNILDDGEVGFGSTEYIVFRAREGVDADFVYYLISSPLVREPAIKSMVGSSGRQRVQTDVVQGITVMVPTLEEQEAIAGILKLLDDKIAVNRKINHNLEQQVQSYFQELFVDNVAPEWITGTISDFGAVVGGSTPSKAKPEYYTKSGIAWITPKDLSINKSKFISHGENDITDLGLKNSSATIMPKGTVLFSSRAPIGYIAIAAGEVTTNQGFKSIVPKLEIGTAFVYFFLKRNLSIIEGMASGSTFKEVSGSTMKNIPAVIPDNETLAKFNDFCAPIFAQQQVLEEQSQSLVILRDNLLPKLMSGEVDVSDILL